MKAFTDLSQSKVLAEILPLESADGFYEAQINPLTNKWENILFVGNEWASDEVVIPAWSLSALLGVLPEGYSFVLTKSFNGKDYYCKLDGKPIETMADNPVDACVAMIEKLNELKML